MSRAVPESDVLRALSGGPLTLADLEKVLPYGEWVEDRRWLGVTVYRLLGDGRIRPVSCGDGHSHDGGCLVEVVR